MDVSENLNALLCSAGLGAMPAWCEAVLAPGAGVAFVDIAAQPLGNPPFVGACRAALADNVSRVLDLDLALADRGEVARTLDRVDAVFVTGGYPLFLLERARSSGFTDEVRGRIEAAQLAYIGVSAGAALAGPDMAPLAGEDDPGKVADTSCMGLVDFIVIPHVNRHPPEVFEARCRVFGARFKLRPLHDDRAIAIIGGRADELASA